MIRIETLSGKPYETIYLDETDSKYSDIRNHILKTIKRPYPEKPDNQNDIKPYTMYVNNTYIKLFRIGQLINFDDDISFDKDDCVLQISINYEYVYYKFVSRKIIVNENNILGQIINLIKDDHVCMKLIKEEEQTEEICKLAVQQNGYALQYVKEQTEEICKLAIQQNSNAIQFVKEQTEELCKLAVQKNAWTIQYIREQTEELCKLAVQKNASTIRFVKIKQTEELCKLAVQQNGSVLKDVKEQTEEICKLAIQQDPLAFLYVKENMKHLFM